MLLLSVLYAALIVVVTVYIYGLRLPQRLRYWHIPGPTPAWLIGGVKTTMKMGQPKAYQMWGEKYGPGMHPIHLASTCLLNVSNPDTARKILYMPVRPNINRGSVMPAKIRAQNEASILWKSGTEWRDLRAAWQPMFFTGSLENYMPIFERAANFLAEELSWAATDKAFVDMHSLVQDMSLNVVGQAAFGVDLHTQKADKAEVSDEEKARSSRTREAAQELFLSPMMSVWIIASRLFPFLLPLIRRFAHRYPDRALKQVLDARDPITHAVRRLIKEHRSSLQVPPGGSPPPGTPGVQDQPERGDSDVLTPAKQPNIRRGVAAGSFIDLLVKGTDRITGEGFSDVSIAQQALTMLLAGFETTANTLTFTLYLLARSCNAEKQAKIVAEVDALGKDWVASFADLEERLPYMDAAIKESLRLYPPAHTLMREAESDMLVEGYSVPKGSWFSISVYALHNDARIWGDSVATFLPERWLTDDPAASKKAKNSFFGFGDGPRVCPGSRFALTEAKLALVRVFQKFTLELQPGQEPLAIRDSITMSPRDGVHLRPTWRGQSVKDT